VGRKKDIFFKHLFFKGLFLVASEKGELNGGRKEGILESVVAC